MTLDLPLLPLVPLDVRFSSSRTVQAESLATYLFVHAPFENYEAALAAILAHICRFLDIMQGYEMTDPASMHQIQADLVSSTGVGGPFAGRSAFFAIIIAFLSVQAGKCSLEQSNVASWLVVACLASSFNLNSGRLTDSHGWVLLKRCWELVSLLECSTETSAELSFP